MKNSFLSASRKTIFFIPARKGSKGIPNKNIQIFNGKPLLTHTIDQIASISSTEQVSIILSTDSNEYVSLALKCRPDIQVHIRSSAISQDFTPMQVVLADYLSGLPDELLDSTDICLLQPTSPFRNFRDIASSFDIYYKYLPLTLVSVTAVKHAASPEKIMVLRDFPLAEQYQPNSTILNRQQIDCTYLMRNGAIYIFTARQALNCLLTHNLSIYEMPFHRSIDIDTPYDLDLCEALINIQPSDI